MIREIAAARRALLTSEFLNAGSTEMPLIN